jgi:hypothetical protein
MNHERRGASPDGSTCVHAIPLRRPSGRGTVEAVLSRVVVALVLVACGDNVGPCEGPMPAPPAACTTGTCTDLYVVAHEDDDLLFMNPDIASDVAGGHRVIVVYVTAGELGDPSSASYWQGRERGMLAAYGSLLAAGQVAYRDAIDPLWTAATETIDGLTFVTYRGGAVELVFLRLGDFQTQCLWEDVDGCSTVNPHPPAPPYLAATKGTAEIPAQQVTGAQLIDVLAELAIEEHATTIGTLDSTNVYFDALGGAGDGYHEYWDHYFTALFATAAAGRAQPQLGALALRSYRGYTISREMPDLSPEQACGKLDTFAHYAIYDTAIVKPDRRARFADCPSCFFTDDYGVTSPGSWERRQLVSATVATAGPFALEAGGACISSALALGDCGTAAAFTRTPSGQLATTGGCLDVGTAPGHTTTPPPGNASPPSFPPDPVALVPCDPPAPSNMMFVQDDGQIRTAMGRCLTASPSGLVADDCRPTIAGDHVTGTPDASQAWSTHQFTPTVAPMRLLP